MFLYNANYKIDVLNEFDVKYVDFHADIYFGYIFKVFIL